MKYVIDNLHRDWKNWWRRQRLYFGWIYDTCCAAEIRFHCRVPGMTGIPSVYYSIVLLWVLFYSDTVKTVIVTNYLR